MPVYKRKPGWIAAPQKERVQIILDAPTLIALEYLLSLPQDEEQYRVEQSDFFRIGIQIQAREAGLDLDEEVRKYKENGKLPEYVRTRQDRRRDERGFLRRRQQEKTSDEADL